jgi:DNA-binding NtrC family response regulator
MGPFSHLAMPEEEKGRGSIPPGAGLVAVVDDDPTARRLIRFWLERAGYRVVEHSSARSVLDEDLDTPDLACVDLGLGEETGMKVLQHLRGRDGELPIIVVTAQRELETAVAAMQAGAYDYVTKPLDRDRLLLAVNRAQERRALLSNVRRLESALTERSVLGSIVGKSPVMRELAQHVRRVLESDVALCLSGESGTGKELVARAIHTGGPRGRGPFVAINCAGIPAQLQESELFGHERGAFTGATLMRRGCFEQANGGTLLLDEIGEMSLGTQASLLRTLQEKTVRRVGGSGEIPIDVRIICATHRDLRAEVEAGRFREDLYFRLVVYPIHLPPLRDRLEDLPLLVGHFLRTLSLDIGRQVHRISAEALQALARHRWPGNVRELQNVVHRSLLACRGDEITLADLPPDIRELGLPSLVPQLPIAENAQPLRGGDEVMPLRELERRAIQRALRVTRGSVGRAAKLLGIGRATLYRRIATLDLSRDVA